MFRKFHSNFLFYQKFFVYFSKLIPNKVKYNSSYELLGIHANTRLHKYNYTRHLLYLRLFVHFISLLHWIVMEPCSDSMVINHLILKLYIFRGFMNNGSCSSVSFIPSFTSDEQLFFCGVRLCVTHCSFVFRLEMKRTFYSLLMLLEHSLKLGSISL